MSASPSFGGRVIRALVLALSGVLVVPFAIAPPEGVPAALLAVNPAVLSVAAALAGGWAAPRVGLRSRLIHGDRVAPRGVLGGAIAGLLVGLVVAPLDHATAGWWQADGPPTLLQGWTPASLVLGVLYGGLTEEVLFRWGVLSVLVLVARRVLATRHATIAAVVLAAVAFAAAHLPVVLLDAGAPTLGLVVRTVGWNALLGLLFGERMVRVGLEGAFAAHAGFHVAVAACALVASWVT